MKTIKALLQEIRDGGFSERDLHDHSYKGLGPPQRAQLEANGYSLYQGKVREVLKKGDQMIILHSDRLSAFDRFIHYTPYRGSILNGMSNFWLKKATEVVPTHLIEQIDERALRVEAMVPYKVEVIVRGYMAGSMMRAYEKGTREFCGVTLPEGLKRYDKLQTPIITPTTKAEVYQHDEEVDPETLIKRGVCTEEEWNKICDHALGLFNFGQEVYQSKNWILVDTKYEFGRNARGEIKVIDEIHTPDSSRLWIRDSYDDAIKSGGEPKMLDKENVRRYLASQGFTGEGPVPTVPVNQLVELSETYLEVAERLIDKPLEAQKKYEFKI